MTFARRDLTVSGNGRSQEIVDELGQCSWFERLRDEPDAAGLDEPVRIGGRPGRERHHGDVPGCRIAFQPLDDRQTVHLGHVVVDKDQVGMLRSGQRQAAPTCRGRKDPMSMGAEQLGKHAQDEVVVVDNQDREPRRY